MVAGILAGGRFVALGAACLCGCAARFPVPEGVYAREWVDSSKAEEIRNWQLLRFHGRRFLMVSVTERIMHGEVPKDAVLMDAPRLVSIDGWRTAVSGDTLILTRPTVAFFISGFPIRLDTVRARKMRTDTAWEALESRALVRNASDTGFEITFLGGRDTSWVRFSRRPGADMTVEGLVGP